MLNIFADALLIATRLGQTSAEDGRQSRNSDLDHARRSGRDLRDWEALRQSPFSRS